MRQARVFTVALAGLFVLAAPRAVAAPEATLRINSLPAELTAGWEIARGDAEAGLAEVARMRFVPARVPGSWQSQGGRGHGVFWYRLRFDIDPTLWSIPLALTCEHRARRLRSCVHV